MTENEAKPMPSEAIESSGGVPVNERMLRSIVYGSIATPIKKPESDHTHKWTIYVRGFHNEDLSTYVKRVIIKLHESFQNPTRSIPCLLIKS
jgi:YEATS domain-containing protein 4